MAIGGMYRIQNPMDTAMRGMAQAAGTYGGMSKNTKVEHEAAAKTVGGGIMAAGGAASAGYSIGSAIGSGVSSGATVGGYWGAAIGAVVGGLAYLLS